MLTLNTIIWLFPILFMIHDFEEIILTQAWKVRYQKQRAESKMKKVPFSDFMSTASFSCGVIEEFIIFSIVALISCMSGHYFLWYGLFFGIVLHFAIHLKMSLQFHAYTPGIFTAALFLPIGICLLVEAQNKIGYSYPTLVLSCVVGFLCILGNLVILHKGMNYFEKWINDYANKGKL